MRAMRRRCRAIDPQATRGRANSWQTGMLGGVAARSRRRTTTGDGIISTKGLFKPPVQFRASSGTAPGVVAIVLSCLGASAVHGDGAVPAWTIKGFGTFSTSGTDTDRLEFVRDNTQASGVTRGWGVNIDSRLGLQLDMDFSQSLHGAVQWVARDHAGNFFEQNLDWAFVRWRATADLDLRVGRLGLDTYMLSDYRNVGYAYPWIRPPHEFYSGQVVYHFDGADVTEKLALGEGYLTVKGFGGYSFLQVPVGQSPSVDQGVVVAGGSLAYEYESWRARLGYAHYRTQMEAEPLQPLFAALQDPLVNVAWPGASSLVKNLSNEGKHLHYMSIGLAYDDGTWLAQAEGSYIDSNLVVFPSVAAGYLSLGRRFGQVTVFSLLGIAKNSVDSVKVPPLQLPVPEVAALRATVDDLLKGNGVDEKSVSLGARWDVYENIALKAQWSHYWLGQNGTQLWVEPASGPTPDTVNVWSVGVDFLF
ncbi:MAG: hypothetical protein H6R26_619 [Proteobacteria bacterium]|nr:hypothetical protein [Pseudomonadota bacterium]